MHYSSTIGTLVLEIYPLIKRHTEIDKNLRLDYEIDKLEETLKVLSNYNIEF